MAKKIVIIGPESTGKSTLSNSLALHYNSVWCKEYAREYLTINGTNYTYENLIDIAKGQINLENEIDKKYADNQNAKLFFDTDMYVIKVWFEYVFGKCPNFVLQQIAKTNCDLFLLCNIDLPWVKDELREYPDLKTREILFNIYKDIVINSGVPWALVSGTTIETRTSCAIESIEKILQPI